MNSKYFQVSLEHRIKLPRVERLRGEGLKTLFNLEKWNTSVFACFMMSSNFFRRIEAIL